MTSKTCNRECINGFFCCSCLSLSLSLSPSLSLSLSLSGEGQKGMGLSKAQGEMTEQKLRASEKEPMNDEDMKRGKR